MNNKTSLGSIMSLFLSIFFSIIAIFTLFAILHIEDYDAFPAVLAFAIINLIVIIIITGYGKAISAQIGLPSYISLCTVTALYTLLQFVHLGLAYRIASTSGYVLYHLIVLFVYFLIIIPLAIMGSTIRNQEKNKAS